MSDKDLLCCLVLAEAAGTTDRPAGARHVVVAFAKLGGGNEQAKITQQLAQIGWKVIEVRDAKDVSSHEQLPSDDPVKPALIRAREQGFAYLVHSARQ